MAYTLTASQIDDVVAVALDERLPEMMDTVYVKHVLFHRLDMDRRITAQGGNNILQPILYAKPPGGSYLGSGPFDITRRQTKTMLQFHWKQYYATLNIDGLTELQASGLNSTFQIVDIELDACRMRLYEDTGLDVFLDGTGNFGAAMTGADLAIAAAGTYGGIVRGTDPAGATIISYVDSAGGVITLPQLQNLIGQATVGVRPNLIVTTQHIWDQICNRIQPAQRHPQQGTGEQLAAAGFSVVTWMGIDIAVDNLCPTGYLFAFNTDTWRLVAHERRAGIEKVGPIPLPNADAKVWHLKWAGELVCGNPRLNSKATGLT
jgi:hypothetical protein